MDGAIIFLDGEWREAKLGVVYEPQVECVERARYYATLECSAAFGRKMRALAVQGWRSYDGRDFLQYVN